MKKSNVIDLSSRAENTDPLTDLIRQGARKLIEQAIEAELAVYMCWRRAKIDQPNRLKIDQGVEPVFGGAPAVDKCKGNE